ncbi:MAG: hypothetical protein ACNA8P_01175 [Phycisphaerales bacterium]
MAMSPSRKKKFVLLGLALGALAIDRGLVFSGGSAAQADAGTEAATAGLPGTPSTSGAAPKTVPVAVQLETLREHIEAEAEIVDRNAFRLPDLLMPQVDEAPVLAMFDEPTPAAAPQQIPDLPRFEVSSVISNSNGRAMAVINGTPIRLGETRNGITLIEVSSRTATIRYAERTVQLRLSE